MDIYDAIYALAADEGRGETLFGSCGTLAREAFRRSLIGKGFPIVWFEVPLSGEPRFDLHVALSREALCSGARFLPGAGNGYDELFRWYSEEEAGGGGLAFAYDVCEGRIDAPAVHANVNGAPLGDVNRFFDIAAGDGAGRCYDGFASRLPQGWRVWYIGVHPGRPGAPLRVDCFVDHELKRKYTADVALLECDLRSCGFSAASNALPVLAAPILESPFTLELQFDVMRDGTVGSTLGISAGFSVKAAQTMRSLLEDGGTAAVLMSEIERLALADARWRHVHDTMFSKLVKVHGDMLAMYCVPTFVKLRMRCGEPLDAKVYFQASASTLE